MAPHVLFVCTGNATRSLIAARLVQDRRPDWTVTSRGTMAYEGLPPSHRTRAALSSVGIHDHDHVSRQVRDEDLAAADLVVCFEVHHVAYVRRHHAHAAGRTATLRRLVRDLPGSPPDLRQRLVAMRLDDAVLEPWEEVDDPAGGDTDTFVACAAEIAALVDALLPRL
jgi:protein-tyrosine phosphatase